MFMVGIGSAQFILSGWLPAGPTGRHFSGGQGNFVFLSCDRRNRRKGVDYTPFFVLEAFKPRIYR